MLNYIIKRFIDLLFSMLILIVFSPLLIIIAVAIIIDSDGPVFFKQIRLKKDGEKFTIYKFRTMIENAEQLGTGLFNYADDFRVTKIGKFLRKSSLDELPQLINILKGDMSIVGPRPPVYYELGNYEDLNDDYKRRFSVLPGITGLAQVNGRNEISWDKKVEYDNRYIDLFKQYGVLIDFKILVMTIINVLNMSDTYETKDQSLQYITDDEIKEKAGAVVVEKAKAFKEVKSTHKV